MGTRCGCRITNKLGTEQYVDSEQREWCYGHAAPTEHFNASALGFADKCTVSVDGNVDAGAVGFAKDASGS